MTLDDRHDTWATSDRFVPRTFVRPFLQFTQVEAASGIVLLVAAAAALIWANSGLSHAYVTVFDETRIQFTFGPVHLDETFAHIINDGLMAIFFFVVGLEIKRELVLGDLRDPKAASLPVLAALGGMIFPALIYIAFAAPVGAGAARGWGIPMATDIAFVVGVISLLGKRVPSGAKLFILALAIADDIGAIAVIAIFYTSDLRLGWLAAALIGLVAVWVAQRVKIRSLAFYVPLALAIWFATLESGIHATLAGVALGFLTPARALYSSQELNRKARRILDTFPLGKSTHDEERADYEAQLLSEIATESVAPLSRLERSLLPWSSFLVVPLFALANAGVSFAGADLTNLAIDRVALGVAVGLLVGKTVGITLFTFLAVRFGLARLPARTGWNHIVGLAALGGIGFTVSLFVTGLAFNSAEFTDLAKVGIFTGSALSGILGSALLWRSKPKAPQETEPEPVHLGA
ncbi:MAG: Na+/H+ antiporter NhaA [Acidimicrobiia bacterium]